MGLQTHPPQSAWGLCHSISNYTTQHHHHNSQHLLSPPIKESTILSPSCCYLLSQEPCPLHICTGTFIVYCTIYVHRRRGSVYSMFVFILIVFLNIYFYSNCYFVHSSISIIIIIIIIYYCLCFLDLVLWCYLFPSALLCYLYLFWFL